MYVCMYIRTDIHYAPHFQIKRKREIEMIEKEKNSMPAPTSFVSKHSEEVRCVCVCVCVCVHVCMCMYMYVYDYMDI